MMGWCRLPAARAYAFGLYVDDAAFDSTATVTTDAKHQGLATLLTSKSSNPGSCVLSLRLLMARDVTGDHVAKGFEKSFAKRLHVLQLTNAVPTTGEDTACLMDLVARFRAVALKTGGRYQRATSWERVSLFL